jgi:hypothetical protein
MSIAWALVVLLTIFIIHFMNVMVWDPAKKTIELSEACRVLQSGDLILFKALDHYSSLAIMSYYTHIGMVCILEDRPYVLEAAYRTDRSKPHILLTNFVDRVKQYRGFMYHKPLSKPMTDVMLEDYKNFIEYARKNMYYETRIIRSAIKKAIGLEGLGDGTNCGELLFMALQKVGLLEPDAKVLHHLVYLCNLTKLKNGYEYCAPAKIEYSYLHTVNN